MDAAPGEGKWVRVPYEVGAADVGGVSFSAGGLLAAPTGELILTISFRLRKSEAWAPAGYEVGFAQYVVQKAEAKTPAREACELRLTRQGKHITLQSKYLKVRFDRGWLTSLSFGDGELIAAGPKKDVGLRPNFFRALTDNDMSFLNFVPVLTKFAPLRIWRFVSRHLSALRVKAKRLSPSSVRLRVHWSPGACVAYGVRTVFTVHGSGEIEVEHRAGGLVPMLRVGVRLGLRKELARVQWYGRGPGESYCDRKTGQKLRLNEADVADLEHRYMRPQENGHRTDVRSLRFTRPDGAGLRIEGDGGVFEFNAGAHSQERLDDAQHLYELLQDDCIHLCVDGRQRGVGGDMPGSAFLHAPYKLGPGKYGFKFVMKRA